MGWVGNGRVGDEAYAACRASRFRAQQPALISVSPDSGADVQAGKMVGRAMCN